MALCPKCGAYNPGVNKYCSNCGAPMSAPEASTYASNPYRYTPPERSGSSSNYQAPLPLETGGIIVWSVISILLCMIPGIVALVYAVSINSAPTAAIQQEKLSNAKLWCTISTFLGVIGIVISLLF